MKPRTFLSGAALLAASLTIASADPKEDVTAAAKKLAEADNYAWTTKTKSANSDRVTESSGKTTKDGLIHYSITMGDRSVEMVRKGEKGAMKGEEGWRTFEELENAAPAEGDNAQGRRRRPGGFRGGFMRNVEVPSTQAMEILENVESLSAVDGAYKATLSADTVKEMMSFRGGRRRGGNEGGGERQGPEIKDASGTVTFWIKDGVLSKMETTTKGTMNWNGEDRTIERTSTVEISGVGETKIEVPEEVKSELSS